MKPFVSEGFFPLEPFSKGIFPIWSFCSGLGFYPKYSFYNEDFCVARFFSRGAFVHDDFPVGLFYREILSWGASKYML